jgi:hypothetical protein
MELAFAEFIRAKLALNRISVYDISIFDLSIIGYQPKANEHFGEFSQTSVLVCLITIRSVTAAAAAERTTGNN